MEKTTTKPKVQLSVEDGNVFSIIARVSKALRRNGTPDKASDFVAKVKAAKDYDAVLRRAMEFCDVE